MGNGGSETKQRHGGKKKTPLQVQSLERLYAEDQHPNAEAMQQCAAPLGLTYFQVRKWFADRRRKDRNPRSREAKKVHGGSGGSGKIHHPLQLGKKKVCTVNKRLKRTAASSQESIQVLHSREYILAKVFRKDGPPLGTEFDPLPENAFTRTGFVKNIQSSVRPTKITKKRKLPDISISKSRGSSENNSSKKSYGIGKGLMTVWRVTNPDTGSYPPTIDLVDRNCASPSVSKKQSRRVPVQKRKAVKSKVKEKHKCTTSKRKVPPSRNGKQMTYKHCGLAMDELESVEQSTSSSSLMDDEELELSEMQTTPNRPRCSAHLSSNGTNGCPFCKDMLGRFPPGSVKMKHPLSVKPWISSMDLVKKFFKVLQFLYMHAVRINICAFTLDELSLAFLDKDSLLLGKIHVALLKLLLSDLETEMTSGFFPRASKDCRFLGFIQSVQQHDFDVNFWVKALNPLTWTEILRQVLTAAGFGSKYFSRRGTLNKERNQMALYGLRPRTIKGELFCLLSAQGSGGLKLSELSRTSQIVSLGLQLPSDELERLIYSTLSSDITLFEKIAPSAFRLRLNTSLQKDEEGSAIGSDDSGSVDDGFLSPVSSCGSEENMSEGSAIVLLDQQTVQQNDDLKRKSKKITPYVEIDESFSGEAWLLGLMEGDYSDLSVEEKLDALVALVDLTSSAFSLRVEESAKTAAAIVPVRYSGSGGKLKKVTYQHALTRLGKNQGLTGFAVEAGSDVHPLQSINLGSDRRYNNYWLFLGPCHLRDPGHRRVYFESSEDGHWEVIDTKHALSSLIFSLDGRGTREAHLLASLQKIEGCLAQAMVECMEIESEDDMTLLMSSATDVISGSGASPVSDVDNAIALEKSTGCHTVKDSTEIDEHGRKDEERIRWEKLQVFDKWVWDMFYSNLNSVKNNKRSYFETLTHCGRCHDLYWRDEKHCHVCHATFELDFDLEERYAIHVATCKKADECGAFPIERVLPSQLQALKAAMHAMEAAIPVEALVDSWMKTSHKLWTKRLRRTSSLPELLQVIADFVAAIKVDWLCDMASHSSSNMLIDDIVVLFHTMPQTTSAVALWMMKLDSLITSQIRLPCLEAEKNTPK